MTSALRRFRNDLAELREIAPWIEQVIRPVVTPDVVGALIPLVDLALSEVCANILVHGQPQGSEGFSVTAEVAADVLHVTVVDETDEFVLDTVTEPDPAEPAIHGYGVMIVRQLTSRFEVIRIGDSNHTILDFPLTTPTVQKGTQ